MNKNKIKRELLWLILQECVPLLKMCKGPVWYSQAFSRSTNREGQVTPGGSSDSHVPWPFSGEASGEGEDRGRHQSRWGQQALGAKAVLARPRRMQVLGENISVCEYERHSPRAEAGSGLWAKWPDSGTELLGSGLEQPSWTCVSLEGLGLPRCRQASVLSSVSGSDDGECDRQVCRHLT